MARPQVRFDVRLEGRTARLRLAAPIETALVRLVRLESALEPLDGRVDLRDGPRAFQHRRGRVLAAEAEIDLMALARGVGDPAVAISLVSARDDRVELALRDAVGALSTSVRFEALARDLRLESMEPAHEARLRALLPRSPLIEIAGVACTVRDPLGWALREALMPAGYRAPRAVAGSLRAAVRGKKLALRLDAEPNEY